MRQVWIITKRELASFFDSLIAYIMIIAFLGFSGFFTWFYGSDIFLVGQASLQVFFNIAYWTLFFFIPAITMRMLAEENRAGTLELLLTKPVDYLQVVGGKFLATLILVGIALALTIPYYITVAKIGPIDHGAVFCGYIGLILVSAMYISIGIFASSITSNQIVSFLLALFIGIFFQLLFSMVSQTMTGFFGETLNYLSASTHFDSVSRGILDSKDVIYFLSIVSMGFIGSVYALNKRNV